MKKVGIVGGTGPEATLAYYQSILAKVQERLGNQEVLPELFIASIDMYRIFQLLETNRHADLVDYLTKAVQSLERAGADFAVLSANTSHIVFEQVQKQANIPLISIVEATCAEAAAQELAKVGLIGTEFTMEHDFYQKTFAQHGIEVVVPEAEDQQYIHQKIVDELERGVVKPETKEQFLKMIEKLAAAHELQGIILGCTELPLLIKPADLQLPQLNTTAIHVNHIVDEIVGG